MTCLEKLRELKQDWDEARILECIYDCCPSTAYIMHDPMWCKRQGKTPDCGRCWDRTIHEDEYQNYYDISVRLDGENMRRLGRLTNRLDLSRSGVLAAALKLYEDGLNAVDESRNRPTSMSLEVFTNAKV